MPHVILECSENIEAQLPVSTLLAEIHRVLEKQLPTDLSTCKSRCVVHKSFYLGDGHQSNAFVHLTVKIMSGRTDEVQNILGNQLVTILKKYFEDYPNKSHLQISVEIVELNKHYFKG